MDRVPGSTDGAGTNPGRALLPARDRGGTRGGHTVTTAVQASLAPELLLPQPVLLLSPGSVSPGFGAQDGDTSQAPPSAAPLPLPCWLALGDL